VQVGFGRVGSRFWGFQTQDVVPDIVTMGKPIGNGHPLAAVVTTSDIAASFANGMEYFNTFGGNPVSCEIGLAVLDVVEDERLQERAARVGGRLRAGLEDLARRHAIVGDVRGLGLFLGIELVRDRETLEPAAEEAAYVVERMKDHGILLSTDGPLHNVIKMKPPLVFSEADADRVVAAYDRVLGEDFVTRVARA
jgi:4-aminobutyrate aminotransferase-like enzyme